MLTVEQRLDALETMLLLGGGAADVKALIRQQTIELARSRTERNVGNVLGGMIRTEIAPFYTSVGPVRQDLDASFPVSFDVVVPEEWLRIKYFRLRIKPTVIRSSVTVAADVGTQTSTGGGGQTSSASSATSSGASSSSSSGSSSASSSGASSSSTSAAGSSHSHSITGQTTGNGGNHSHVATTSTDGDTLTTIEDGTVGTHGHVLETHNHSLTTGSPGDHQHSITGQATAGESAHTHGMAHTHNIDHTHGIAHTHNIDHTHTVANHTHDVAGHGHTLTLAIAEGGAATSVQLWIAGVDRTAELGGPWSAAVTVDIQSYLVNARQVPVPGVYTIELRSATTGAVEVWGEIYGIVKAIS